MGETFSAAQSDLGGDDFIFASASMMDGETLPVLWGVTLPNLGSVLIWRQDFARTRQLTLSPCFSQARMEEKSREFAEKGNEICAN
jgi:hypothetical protein